MAKGRYKIDDGGTTSSRIREMCEERGWKPSDLHSEIDKYMKENEPGARVPSKATIYSWLNEGVPSSVHARILSCVFGVSVDVLVGKTAPEDGHVRVDLSSLPKQCLENVRAYKKKVVMPDGEVRTVINIKDDIALPKEGGDIA